MKQSQSFELLEEVEGRSALSSPSDTRWRTDSVLRVVHNLLQRSLMLSSTEIPAEPPSENQALCRDVCTDFSGVVEFSC